MYSEEFVVKNKSININGDMISFIFDIVYRNGDKETESFKLNKLTGELINETDGINWKSTVSEWIKSRNDIELKFYKKSNIIRYEGTAVRIE